MTLAATTGVLQGGWAYVWASFLITWLFLGGYALSLWIRGRRR